MKEESKPKPLTEFDRQKRQLLLVGRLTREIAKVSGDPGFVKSTLRMVAELHGLDVIEREVKA